MKRRLPDWAILAGGAAVAAAGFFASADITHWVMGLHRTDVVVVPGPTVYLTRPAGYGHTHERALTALAPAGPANGGGVRSPRAAHPRPDQGGGHSKGPRPGAAHHRGGRGVDQGHQHH